MHVLHLSYPLSQLSSEACFLRSARVGIFTKAMCSNQHILMTTDKLLVLLKYDSSTFGTHLDPRTIETYLTSVLTSEKGIVRFKWIQIVHFQISVQQIVGFDKPLLLTQRCQEVTTPQQQRGFIRARLALSLHLHPAALPHLPSLRSHDHWLRHHRHCRLIPDGHGGRDDDAAPVDHAPLLLLGHLGAAPSSPSFTSKGAASLLGEQGDHLRDQVWGKRKEHSPGVGELKQK